MIRSYKYREYFRAAQFIWAALVFIIHVMPVDSENMRRFEFAHADKWIHGTLFFVLAALGYLATSHRRSAILASVLVFTACVGYGGMLEVIQYAFTEERSGDILDLLADTAGTIVGLGIAKFLKDRITPQS